MITLEINNKNILKIILQKLNILYIEDEQNIRENIANTLKILCDNVYSVENIQEAEEIKKNVRIDIIISDINLNEENGLDFIKKLRGEKIDIPVILLSAYTDKEYLLEATKLKLVDYLVKPVDFKELNEALFKACQEIVSKANYIIDFENNISYNVLQKKLFNKSSNEEIALTAKEVHFLDYLIQNNQRVVSHQELKDNIWEDSFEATESALKNLLTKLRKKVGKESIKNISGVGFRIIFK